MSARFDVFLSHRSCEGERAARALRQALQGRGLCVFLSDDSAGNHDVAMRALCASKMAVILGTETYGRGIGGTADTLRQLQFIVAGSKPYFLIKMCDRFLEEAARSRLVKDIPAFSWEPEQDAVAISVPPELTAAIEARVASLPHATPDLVFFQLQHLTSAEESSADVVFDAGHSSHPETSCTAHDIASTTDGVRGGVSRTMLEAECSKQGALASSDNSAATSFSSGGLGFAPQSASILRRSSSNSSSSVSSLDSDHFSCAVPQDLQAFARAMHMGGITPVKNQPSRSKRLYFFVLLAMCLALGIAVGVSIAVLRRTDSGHSGSDSSGKATEGSTGPHRIATAGFAPTTSNLTPAQLPASTTPPAITAHSTAMELSCNGSTPVTPDTAITLDCLNSTSRALFARANTCEAAAVINCCCDEFFRLQRVVGSVIVRPSLESLSFGRITSIGGDVLAEAGALRVVDFGRIRHVRGSIQLRDNNITSTSSGSLSRVSGSLNLYGNALTSIHFGNLTRVDSSLDLRHNSLVSVEFGTLTTVGDDLELSFNDLTSVHLRSLSSVYGSLTFGRNHGLTSIDFGSLTSVGPAGGRLDLDNTGLTSIQFGSLASVGGGIHLSHSSLASIDFGALTRVGASLYLERNRLTSIDFGSLTHVGQHLTLSYNDLTRIDFGGLLRVGRAMSLHHNDLTSIDFGSVTQVGQHLTLSYNDLTRIGFGQLAWVGGDLDLEPNPLTSIDFERLPTIDGDVTVSAAVLEGSGLSSFVGNLRVETGSRQNMTFVNLTSVDGNLDLGFLDLTRLDLGSLANVTGDLDLRSTHLTSIALGNLTRVGGTFDMGHNSLTTINLGALTSVGNLYLGGNALSSIHFGSLTAVHGRLDIDANQLTSISFGPHLTSVAGALGVHNNHRLSSIDFGNLTSVGGYLHLSGTNLTTIDCGGLSASCMYTDSGVSHSNCPSSC